MDVNETETLTVESAEQIIRRWDSPDSDRIFGGDRRETELYLRAVDELQRSISLTSISNDDDDDKSKEVNGAIQISMARLEDEFRTILIDHQSPIETESIPDSVSSTRMASRTDSVNSNASEQKDEDEVNEDESDSISAERGENSLRSHASGDSGYGISHHNSSSSIASCKSEYSIREMELIPSENMSDLRSIAERMIAAGYLRECVQVYGSVRKHAVDTSLRKLGFEKLSIGDIQRLEWDVLNTKIGKWIRAARVCVRVVFASEKRLCEQIFGNLGEENADDVCFMETVKGPAVQLFNFAEAVSISRRSPEKLFKVLDMHDALLDLLPDLDVVFDSQLSEFVRVQATEILSRLAEAARGMLSEFENAVLREPSKTPVPGGTIHPLTRYVMNYISLISDYKQTLGELIVSKPAAGTRYEDDLTLPEMDFADYEEQTPLSLHLIWTIMILLHNLEGKSKHYKDNSLAHLFIMNNAHYIVQKIKGSPELREMVGDDYLKKLTGKYTHAATSYQRATWVAVLNCLRDEGLHVSGSFSSGVSRTLLRERFKSFNAMFEEVHRTQAVWIVPDTRLREELRISISEKVIPAYRSFLGRFRTHIESGRHPENYIKYSVEDLEIAVLDLFEGCQVPQHNRRRS